MKKKMTSCIIRVSVVLILSLTISLTGCNLLPQNITPTQGSGQTEAVDKVEPGIWEATFSVSLANGKTENWIVDFHVNDDGKTVSSVELIHYIGELTPGTNETALFTATNSPIKRNSFEFSLTELVSYSTRTYKGEVTFTSSKEANGTLNINGDDYTFRAFPITD